MSQKTQTRTRQEPVPLVRKVEDRLRAVNLELGRLNRERELLRYELPRLRNGAPEAETQARLTRQGVAL